MSTTLLILVTLSMLTSAARAQNSGTLPTPQPLHASLNEGDVLRYEVEATVSMLPEDDQTLKWSNPPLFPCEYSLAGIITLRAGMADHNHNLPIQAKYTGVGIRSWQCEHFNQSGLQKELSAASATPNSYQVGPHGEVGFIHPDENHLNYWIGTDLLRKIALDLLQIRISERPVVPGESWKPHGQFTYWRDYLLSDLEVTASNLKFRDLVDVAGHRCAWVTSKFVYSPLDIPASATTASGQVQPVGSTVVAGLFEVSLLLDEQSHTIAWLHRSEQIDNRLRLGPRNGTAQDDEELPLVTVHFTEEATARLIRQDASVEWMSAVKKFEEAPQPKSQPQKVAAGQESSIARAAHLSRTATGKKAASQEFDSLAPTPAGFSRWEKAFCPDTWTCMQFSVALPGSVQISEESPLRTVYLSLSKDAAVNVVVGPPLDRNHQGLTPEGELRKQTAAYVASRLWLASGPADTTKSENTNVDGYPALITTFSAPRRDLQTMSGVLALLYTPWGKIVPVGCAFDQKNSDQLEPICEQIIGSIQLHR